MKVMRRSQMKERPMSAARSARTRERKAGVGKGTSWRNLLSWGMVSLARRKVRTKVQARE